MRIDISDIRLLKLVVIMHSETRMSEGELERAHTDQSHNSTRFGVMLTQYMILTLFAQIKSMHSYRVLERASLFS
jgi:hypothetical protein